MTDPVLDPQIPLEARLTLEDSASLTPPLTCVTS